MKSIAENQFFSMKYREGGEEEEMNLGRERKGREGIFQYVGKIVREIFSNEDSLT